MHDKWHAGERRYFFEASIALLKPTGHTGSIAAIDSDV
jgi:putative transposase